MPSSFGQWLVVVLALAVGLVVGWVVSGRRSAAAPATPTVEGGPTVEATVDQERPAAVVDEAAAPAAVTDEPAPAEQEAPPAAATLAAEATALPSAESIDTTESAEVRADDEPVAAEPVAAETEPVVAEADADEKPAGVDAAEPVTADVEPVAAEVTGPVAAESGTPAVVPAPRAAVEDAVPAATAEAAADDFRRIQGVGPKMAAGLQAAGVRTYQQLAELDEAALRETIKAAGLRATASVATWPQQAKVLAAASAEAEQALPAGTGEDA
ncbi:hypothetical protein ACL02O_16180 [Micromonospora sp. MS34]|uniref:hypothetical protein n=1 Tax=Micromonospora sp. MS34 TaxID=3385971 RepID=UPI0039A2B72F